MRKKKNKGDAVDVNETLLRMMEMMKITYENRARILKLEKRFYQRSLASELLKGSVILE